MPLLFVGTEDAYELVFRQDGTLRDAIADLAVRDDVVVHVHWEEFVLRGSRSSAEADDAAAAFLRDLEAYRGRGGKIVWTVHNELPHEIPYHRQFLAMRRELAAWADVILVHDDAACDVLASQVPVDRSRVVVLPHPSYLDRFEDEATMLAALGDEPERRIQAFGHVRLQKGYGEMIGMLPAAFLAERGAHIRISGRGVEAAAVVAQQAERLDVHWDLRHVPDDETPRLLRSAACVVLPYDRVLTSGVALLAMSVGAFVVAVDLPQLRAVLPVAAHRFLYARGDDAALRRVVDDVLGLSRAERRAVVEANLAIARDVRPAAIASRLDAIYRGVLARPDPLAASPRAGPKASGGTRSRMLPT